MICVIAVMLQYHYRPFNCFDCLLSRSRRCTHWGALDQLEFGFLLSQTITLSVGLYLQQASPKGRAATSRAPVDPNRMTQLDMFMFAQIIIALGAAFVVLGFLFYKTYLLRNKMRNAADRNEYQTAQNMEAANTDKRGCC